MRGYSLEQIVVSQARLGSFLGIAPNTIKARIEDGSLVPDRFSLAYGTEAFSLPRAMEYLETVDWELIERMMSEAGVTLRR